MLPPVDLSEVSRLTEVEFQICGPDVQWITATLETAKFKTLGQVAIRSLAPFYMPIEETTTQEWRELDRLLARLWASHLIYPKIKFVGWSKLSHLENVAPRLLPEFTSRGDELDMSRISRRDRWDMVTTVKCGHCTVGIRLCSICGVPFLIPK